MELYEGCCLEEMKNIKSNSIDLLFCDLPYGILGCEWDKPITLELFWNEINRICKLKCPMFFTTTTKYGVSLINSNPNHFKYDLVWEKNTSSGFLQSGKCPLRKHELIYVFYRDTPYYNLSSHSYFLTNYNNNMKDEGMYGKVKNVKKGFYDPPLPTSVIKINSERKKHPTQKPIALVEWILEYYSKEGDIVLDPTMGSGTTAVACLRNNRKFIGIEKNEEFFEIALNRIKTNI
tara:strand:- start:396 stop:1097 length:702 start_codon:yes stop_codon:yes gene_type:complete